MNVSSRSLTRENLFGVIMLLDKAGPTVIVRTTEWCETIQLGHVGTAALCCSKNAFCWSNVSDLYFVLLKCLLFFRDCVCVCVCVCLCVSVFLKALKYFAKTVRDKFTSNFHFEVTCQCCCYYQAWLLQLL